MIDEKYIKIAMVLRAHSWFVIFNISRKNLELSFDSGEIYVSAFLKNGKMEFRYEDSKQFKRYINIDELESQKYKDALIITNAINSAWGRICIEEKAEWLTKNGFLFNEEKKVWYSEEYGFQLSQQAIEKNEWELNKELIGNEKDKYKQWLKEQAEESREDLNPASSDEASLFDAPKKEK